MQPTLIETNKLKIHPSNPRAIRNEKLEKLKKSITEDPELMNTRPLLVNEQMEVFAGNQRLRACIALGWKDVPCVVVDWDEAKQRRAMIKDNVSAGEWDWDMLANEWDAELLTQWGMDVWLPEKEPDIDDLIADDKEKPATMRITFGDVKQLQEAENEIQELIDRKWPGAFFSVSAGEA